VQRFFGTSKTLVQVGWLALVVQTACGGAAQKPAAPKPSASSNVATATQALETEREGLFESSEFSDATLDLIDLAPEPGAELSEETVLRARLRYSIDRRPNKKYVLFAQFRLPEDKSTFDGKIAPVEKTADVVDLALPMARVVKDERLVRPLQVKFVLAEFVSSRESVVIAETRYVELGPS
jgi:hypothetical protein